MKKGILVSFNLCWSGWTKLIFSILNLTFQGKALWTGFQPNFQGNLGKQNASVKWGHIKGTLQGLRQFLATESPLKVMKNTFYFSTKPLFTLKIFKFLFWLFDHVTQRLDQKDQVNVRFYDVTYWLTNSCNTHIAQYLGK